jgi:hypothetical protein
MSKTITEKSQEMQRLVAPSDSWLNSYFEVWNKYFEDLATAYSFENGFMESLIKNTSGYFESFLEFYKSRIDMYLTICRCYGHASR